MSDSMTRAGSVIAPTRRTSAVLTVCCRSVEIAMGLVFLWSGIQKFNLPYLFVERVLDYGIVGVREALLVATVLPWFELLLGTLLALNILPGGALICASGLLLAFVAVQSVALWSGVSAGCGCLDLYSADSMTMGSVLRTLSMFVLLCASFWCERYQRTGPSRFQNRRK